MTHDVSEDKGFDLWWDVGLGTLGAHITGPEVFSLGNA